MADGKGRPGKGYALAVQFTVRDESLTAGQENHIEDIGRKFCTAMAAKYIAGQREHGGNLFDLSAEALVDCAIDEAIDQVVYLLTLKDKLRGAR